MAITRVDVRPDIIIWAIRRAGYDLENFLVSFPNVRNWIEEKRKPSNLDLERFSYYMDIPFGYLLLEKPLEEKLPIPFFKTDEGEVDQMGLQIYQITLLMQGRQEWLRHYLKENGHAAHSYVGKFDSKATPQTIIDDIRATLGLTEYWSRSFSTWEEAFHSLVEKIEETGIVLAFSSSVKQDNFRSVDPNKCKGIALADSFAPYVYINMSDAKAAQMLTMIFGIAHIWMGRSAGFDFVRLCPAKDPVEQLCYEVAVGFLAPETIFYATWRKKGDVEYTTKSLRISPLVVARRLVDIGVFSEFDFLIFYETYISQYTVKREWTKSQGLLHAYQQRRIGKILARHMKKAIETNRLLHKDAYRMAKIKGDIYRRLLT